MNNLFFVGIRGNKINILMPIPKEISKEEALNLAAWLVALADDNDEFGIILEKVQNT